MGRPGHSPVSPTPRSDPWGRYQGKDSQSRISTPLALDATAQPGLLPSTLRAAMATGACTRLDAQGTLLLVA